MWDSIPCGIAVRSVPHVGGSVVTRSAADRHPELRCIPHGLVQSLDELVMHLTNQVLRSAPTDGHNRGLALGVMNGGVEGVDKTIRRVRREVGRDRCPRSHGGGLFDGERRLLIAPVVGVAVLGGPVFAEWT